MKIGWFFTEIWRYINFQNGGRPPSWNCFTTIPDQTTHEVSVAGRSRSDCEISCKSDTQIWRYSYLNFSHIWLEMPIQAPKMGVLGDFNLTWSESENIEDGRTYTDRRTDPRVTPHKQYPYAGSRLTCRPEAGNYNNKVGTYTNVSQYALQTRVVERRRSFHLKTDADTSAAAAVAFSCWE